MSDSFNGGYGNPAPPPAPSKDKHRSIPVWAWITGGVLLAAIVVLITLLFTGGDDKKDESAPQPAPTVTVTEEAPEPKPAPAPKETVQAAPVPKDITTEEGFIDFVRDEYPILETIPDNEIIDRANRACDMFDGGATMDEVVVDAVKEAKSGSEAEGFGAIVGGSVAAVCPEHYDEIAPYL